MGKKNKKRILFFCHTMRGGGVENVLLNITNRLLQLDYEITFLLQRKEGNFLQFIPETVVIKYLAKGNEFYPKNILFKSFCKVMRRVKLKMYKRHPFLIRKLILRENYDIEVVFLSDLFGIWEKIINKDTKTIGWVHSILIGDRGEGDGFLVEASYHFDKVVCVAHVVRNNIIKFFPKFADNSLVIYNPINKEEIIKKSEQEISWNYKYPVFVSIGRLTRLKGYFPMMHIHKRLLSEGFYHEIVIVGMGEDYDEMQEEIQKLEIAGTYHLAGHQQNPYPYLKKADFFFLFSNTEGYPLVVQEALLLKKPMIVTKVGGIPEMVEDGKTAMIIERDDEQMYKAMKEFLTHPNLVSQLKENCDIAAGKYDENIYYNQMLEVLK